MSAEEKKTEQKVQDWPGVSPFPIMYAQGVAGIHFGPQVCKIHLVDTPTPDNKPVTVAEVVLPTTGFLDLIMRATSMLQDDGVIANMEVAQKRDMAILKKFKRVVREK